MNTECILSATVGGGECERFFKKTKRHKEEIAGVS